jgi:hypothetical protein
MEDAKIIRGLTKLVGGSGVWSEKGLGSSFTRSGGVSTSFALPLSFRLDFPPKAGAESCKLSEEFDREIVASSSTTTVPESDSNNIGWETELVPASGCIEGSNIDVLPP